MSRLNGVRDVGVGESSRGLIDLAVPMGSVPLDYAVDGLAAAVTQRLPELLKAFAEAAS